MKPRPRLRCGVWTRFKGSAVGMQKGLSLLATFPRGTVDLGGFLTPDLCVPGVLVASWCFRGWWRKAQERAHAQVASFKGGLVVQNLSGPGAWPRRHPSWLCEGFCPPLPAAGFSVCSSVSPAAGSWVPGWGAQR